MARAATTTRTFTSVLNAPARVVWRQATDLAAVNDELWPLLRMTAPPGVRRLDPANVTPGVRLFRSWLLLGGVVPVEYDDLVLVELVEGRFLERSSMLTARVWEHERTVEPATAGSSRLVDRVTFVPRTEAFRPVLALVVPLVFRHRHRRLARRFAATRAAPGS